MLTTRQQEIWQFLAEYVDAHGYPPTVREIGDAVGLASPSTVHAHLANLERAGLLGAIRRSRAPSSSSAGAAKRRSRTVRTPTLPLVGQIAAGGPLLADEAIEDRIAVPEPLGRDADFLLRVKGESMIEAGILEGDIVVVRKQSDARTGEIVVALVGDDESADEATVKTFLRERDGRIRLQPENAALEPLYPEHVEILGKVTGVFRSLGVRRIGMTSSLEPLARPGARGIAQGSQPRVPRVRGVRPARAWGAGLPGVQVDPGRVRGADRRDRVTISRAGQVTAGLSIARWAEARGKSGHRRAGRSGRSWGAQRGHRGGESRRKVEQKGDRRSREKEAGKGEKVG